MWSTLIGGQGAPGQDNSQDGWEDDVDFVDDSENTENENETDAEQLNPRQAPAQSNGGVRQVFVGRLTRFLEQMTQPEEESVLQDYEEDDQAGWQDDDEANFDVDDDHMPTDEDKKVEEVRTFAVKQPEKSYVAHNENNAWGDEEKFLDNSMEDKQFSTMRDSIAQAEAALDQALEDIHKQEEECGSGSDNNDLNEDAFQERQAILEIQREMNAVDPPMVDVTPHSGNLRRTLRSAATSVVTQWATEDGTRDSGPVSQSDDEDIFQDENEESFGPVVDQVPRKPFPMTRTDSLAVQAHVDVEDEDALDETIVEQGAIVDDDNSVHHADEVTNSIVLPAVVDHTPSVVHSRKSRAESFNAILSLEGDTTIANEEEEDSPADYGPVVDQIPDEPSPTLISGSVMPVVADDLSQEFKTDDAMDETVFAKGDASTIDGNSGDPWSGDDIDFIDEEKISDRADESDNVNQSADTTKISSVLQGSTNSGDQANLVDCIPNEDSVPPGTTDPSVIVLAADEDLTRDTGVPTDDDVFGEENEMEFCPVVDHTPFDTTPNRSSAVSLQVEADALAEEFREDDAMDETCFGDTSILGGVADEEVADGWEDDDIKTPAVPNPNMVDQTPSQWGSPAPKNADPSVAVLASVNESVDEEGSEYGPVVDQTPHNPALPLASRSDSVIVQAADMETVEDETLNDDDDGDTFTDELPLGIGAIRSAEDILVDRVPARPESRFGDASTMVAADPSEILSEVDDMMAPEEEQNFGPVVDLTPPSQSIVGRPSTTGSTVAFAPNSVATDDLEEDDGDETEGNDAWNDTILEEATPNPQSGNDEPPQHPEQLVDFLPEEDELSHPPEDASIMGGTASSSVAIGGAQSLLQAEDPKEDDFGPVVDQTPTGQPNLPESAVSTATHVTASELRLMEKEDNIEARSVDFDIEGSKSDVVVDYIPNIREKQTLDSLATVAQSQLSEEEEEEEETTSKFGPVVDHLPTPRNSLAQSRGGSTVDALATVSEVDSAGNERSGWEDDLDLEDASAESDRTDRVSTLGSVRRAQSTISDHDRSISVRFDSTVRSMSLKSPPVPSGRHFPVASQSSSTTDGWEDDDIATDGADASSIGTGGASRMFDESIANAETPPSTPYYRPIISGHIADSSLLQPLIKECPSCANAKTIECPCVQKLIRITQRSGSIKGILVTAEGETLEVDFGEMLKEEVAKRRLLEEEASALRALSASQQDSMHQFSVDQSSLQGELSESHRRNGDLSKRVEDLERNENALRDSNEQLSEELRNAQVLVEDLRVARQALAESDNAHIREIEALKKLLEERNQKLLVGEDLAGALVSLEQKLIGKDAQCQQLEAKVSTLEQVLSTAEESVQCGKADFDARVANYENRLAQAAKDLSNARNALAGTTEALKNTKREADLNARAAKNEIEHLAGDKAMIENQLSQVQTQHTSEMQHQYALIEARIKDLQTLESKLESSEKERSLLLAEVEEWRSADKKSAIVSEQLNSLVKECGLLKASLTESENERNKMRQLIDQYRSQKQALDSELEVALSNNRMEKKALQDSLRIQERRVQELTAQLTEAKQEKEAALADTEAAQSSVWDLEENLDTANALLADAESRAEDLENKLRIAEAQLQEASQKSASMDAERKHAEARLVSLENKAQAGAADASFQASRAAEAEGKLAEVEADILRLREHLESLSTQITTAEERCQNVQTQMSEQLQHEQYNARRAITERDSEIVHLRQEVERMGQQANGQKSFEMELKDAREWINLLQKEKDALSEENEELLVQLGIRQGQIDEALENIENLHRQLDGILMATDAVNNGVDYIGNTIELNESSQLVVDTLFGLQTRYADLETEMAHYTSDRERSLEKRIEDLEEQVSHKESEMDMLQSQLQSKQSAFETKIVVFQKQIESLDSACREKDHLIQAKAFELSHAMSRVSSLESQLHDTEQAFQESANYSPQIQLQTSRAERAESALQHSQAELNRSQSLVQQLEEQLLSREDALRRLESSHDASRLEASRTRTLDQELSEKSARVLDLEQHIKDLEQANAVMSTKPSLAQVEIDSLREEVLLLKTTLDTTQSAFSTKDKEILTLTERLRTLEGEAHQRSDVLGRLGHVSGDDVESLRAQVVLLATALERSETRRAEAMDRLMEERQSNAESFRRLGESVQRFFANVKLRDS